MSDTFKPLTPDEIQSTLIQFMGQNIGEIKKLDTSIVAKNATLQGLTLNPKQILATIPSTPQNQQAPLAPQQPVASPAAQIEQIEHITAPNQSVSTVQEVQQEDPNQLLFDFVNDLQKTPSILSTIQSIDKKTNDIFSLARSISQLEAKIDTLTTLIQNSNAFKKKKEQQA